MYKFEAVAFIFCVFLFSTCLEYVNGGQTYSDSLQVNIKNIHNIHSSVTLKRGKSSLNGATHIATCHNEFCCQFKTEELDNYNQKNLSLIEYSVFAYSGSATFSNSVKGTVEMCGLIKINEDQNQEMLSDYSHLGEVEIYGKFKNTNSTMYPLVQKSTNGLFQHQNRYIERGPENINSGFVYVLEEYQSGFQTFLILNTNLHLNNLILHNSPVEMSLDDLVGFENIAQVEEQTTFDYLYRRLQILAFVVLIYCLEQM